MLLTAASVEAVSGMMQKLEGEFAEWYNLKKKGSGAFWGGRYHNTMVEGGSYLWNCMKYIELNMVIAKEVNHPSEWEWCGYGELVGLRNRYRVTDRAAALRLNDVTALDSFRENYRQAIEDAIDRNALAREAKWTESIAVGSEVFVRSIEEQTTGRRRLYFDGSDTTGWTLRESQASYGRFSPPEIGL